MKSWDFHFDKHELKLTVYSQFIEAARIYQFNRDKVELTEYEDHYFITNGVNLRTFALSLFKGDWGPIVAEEHDYDGQTDVLSKYADSYERATERLDSQLTPSKVKIYNEG